MDGMEMAIDPALLDCSLEPLDQDPGAAPSQTFP
jgi:hypothetical protein